MLFTTKRAFPPFPSGGVFKLALLLVAGVVLSVNAVQASECFKDAKQKMEGSPAFTVSCSTETDCEFMPATAQNASAIAVVDAAASKIQNCWLANGLSKMKVLETPASMKVHVLRYTADVDNTGICTIAEFKPAGVEELTTTFRAQCKDR